MKETILQRAIRKRDDHEMLTFDEARELAVSYEYASSKLKAGQKRVRGRIKKHGERMYK